MRGTSRLSVRALDDPLSGEAVPAFLLYELLNLLVLVAELALDVDLAGLLVEVSAGAHSEHSVGVVVALEGGKSTAFLFECGEDGGLRLVLLHELLLLELGQLHMLVLDASRAYARVQRAALYDLKFVSPLLLQKDLTSSLLFFNHSLMGSSLSSLFFMPLLYLLFNPFLLDDPLLLDPLLLLILVLLSLLSLTEQVFLKSHLQQLPVIVLVQLLKLLVQQLAKLLLL